MDNGTDPTETASLPAKRSVWRRLLRGLGITALVLLVAIAAIYWWWFKAPHEQIANVVYGQRGEQELLLDVFRPPRQNGASVAVMISGSWKSGADGVRPFLFAPFLRRGYTVFAVQHISQPECLIEDLTADVHRAIRFIRHHADDYGIEPDRIGVVGGSSGGHLSLHLATCGKPGPADSGDPVDRESSAVQCVACFFPVTDLLNLGKSTQNPGDGGPPISYKQGFGPRGETMEEWKVLGRELSPIYHVTKDLPPIFIIHGDADTLVPLEQSEWFVDKAKEVGHKVRLDVRPGKKHGWPSMILDIIRFANWFDLHVAERN